MSSVLRIAQRLRLGGLMSPDRERILLRVFGLEEPYEPSLHLLEAAVGEALDRSVTVPDAFRQHLRDNLSVAAQHQRDGLVLERQRRYREALLVSLAVVLFMASLITGIALARSRSCTRRG